MKFLPLILAIGTTAAAQQTQIKQPFLSQGSEAYCFVSGLIWPDGKQYDAIVKLEQISPEGLQINVAKKSPHKAANESARNLWTYSAGLDPMYLHVNGDIYGDNPGDTSVSSTFNTYRFGGKNPTPLIETDKKNVSKIVETPECAGK